MRTLARLRRDDEGVGMLLVMAVITIISALIALSATIAVNGLASGRRHVQFGQALDAAENGVDFALARLQRAWDKYGVDYPIPETPTTNDPTPACNAPAITTPYPSGSFPSESAERSWARTQLLTLAGTHPECIQKGGSGEFLVIKPTDKQTVYSIGWMPDHTTANANARLIKAEYIFSPYRPTDAVLVGSSLSVASSVTVGVIPGAPAAAGSVHANGTITTQGNPTASGPVTSTGTSSASSNNFAMNPGGSVYSTPTTDIPAISALSFYYQNVGKYSSTQWYDLCPDGSVRQGSGNGPCTSSSIWATSSTTTSTGFRGWTFSTVNGAPTWAATKNVQTFPGVYYANAANITTNAPNGNVTASALTIVASSANPDSCATKQYGNITWNGIDVNGPFVPGLFMLADQDLVTTSNYYAGSTAPTVSGLFFAGDQISFQTSSDSVVGGIVGGDQCSIAGSPVPNSEIKNAVITFDPNAYSPVTSIVNTTLWLEYVG